VLLDAGDAAISAGWSAVGAQLVAQLQDVESPNLLKSYLDDAVRKYATGPGERPQERPGVRGHRHDHDCGQHQVRRARRRHCEPGHAPDRRCWKRGARRGEPAPA
jgi:hypothetical protein